MFRWRYLDGDGEDVGASVEFQDREAAEAWMGDGWAELRERGVAMVNLVDEEAGRSLYRMSLSDAPTD